MTYLLPPLNALRAFEAAARHLSFKLAAQELHVTPSAISQQVKTLEERLGIRLFERWHKHLILTDVGQAYLKPLRQAFTQIADATSKLRSDQAVMTLNLGVEATFDLARIRGSVIAFRQHDLRIGIKIIQPAGLRELLEGKVDLAIAKGVNHYPGYQCDVVTDGERSEEFYLICPSGTAACTEITLFRSWILAGRSVATPPAAMSVMNRRGR